MDKPTDFWSKHKIIVAIGSALAAVALLCCTCGRDNGANNNDVDRTVRAVEDDNSSARRAVGEAGGSIDRGRRELDAAISGIERSEEIVRENEKRAGEREQILNNCRRNSSEAKRILEDIERRNKAGAKNP